MAGHSVTVLSSRIWPMVTPAGGTRAVTLVTFDVDGQGAQSVIIDKEKPTPDEVQRAIAADLQFRTTHAGMTFKA
jgi:hypothetical protein